MSVLSTGPMRRMRKGLVYTPCYLFLSVSHTCSPLWRAPASHVPTPLRGKGSEAGTVDIGVIFWSCTPTLHHFIACDLASYFQCPHSLSDRPLFGGFMFLPLCLHQIWGRINFCHFYDVLSLL